MPKAEKVTVSLPSELLQHIEHLRVERGSTRSAVVTELLWEGWRNHVTAQREERYRAAYQALHETDAELAWAAMAAETLPDAWDDGQAEPDATTEANRAAS